MPNPRRRSSAAGCSSRSQRSSFSPRPRLAAGQTPRDRAGVRIGATRRLGRRRVRPPSVALDAAAGRRLRRPGRSGALLREREVRRRARAAGTAASCAIAAAAPSSAPAVVHRRACRRRRSTASSGSAAAASTRSRRASGAPSRDERDWREVRYMVFDTAGRRRVLRGAPRASRGARCRSLRAQVEVAPQWRVADRAELRTSAGAQRSPAGGEGLMLHRRRRRLRARPQRRAAEAEAASRRRGRRRRPPRRAPASTAGSSARSRSRRRPGGASSSAAASSDAMRREPPAIGTTVTYRYRDLTSSGLPRFATYLRPHTRRTGSSWRPRARLLLGLGDEADPRQPGLLDDADQLGDAAVRHRLVGAQLHFGLRILLRRGGDARRERRRVDRLVAVEVAAVAVERDRDELRRVARLGGVGLAAGRASGSTSSAAP